VTRRERAIVSRALEVLHDEGYRGGATAWLESLFGRPRERRYVCPVAACRLAFRFPEERDDHVHVVHGKELR
jgi:hypothetical protein